MGSVNITSTSLAGLYLIKTAIFYDARGSFTKVFQEEEFEKQGLLTGFKESYYSISHKGVVRGMHFQLPPHDHAKLIYATNGKISDVVLDIRQNSPTYGEFFSTELSSKNGVALYLSPGLAHGFESLEDESCVTYLQTTRHAPAADSGVRFDSFGKTWKSKQPIVSDRDSNFPSLQTLITPFKI